MYRPSLTTMLSVAFLAYMANSMWTMAKLFFPPDCSGLSDPNECLKSSLLKNPARDILIFSSLKARPDMDRDMSFLAAMSIEDPNEESELDVQVPLADKVKKNGTMFLCVFTVPHKPKRSVEKDWFKMIHDPETTYMMIPWTVYQVPEAETFNLLGDEKLEEPKSEEEKAKTVREFRPVSHLRSKITLSLMTDLLDMPKSDIPPEIYYLMRQGPDKKHYLPILYIDELSLRIRDLREVNATDPSSTVAFKYRPISLGKLRLFLQFTSALSSMVQLGFTFKDIDEVKGIFADTNLVLLLVTFSVSAVHMLFDFLAFKNDISFWRNKKSMVGLSIRTLLWRAFSQVIVYLYLMDEETSLLVLVPSGLAALIEIWKVTKAFKVTINLQGWIPRISYGSATDNEKSTEEFDSQSMRYLSYVLYPLCLGGAVYSLMYTPHKSWWSWTIQSMVNGVYAFGFLFMLPQLFVNYKLKSVAHLPWRSFMYKAFNTFIDDLFAFIITMPTAHRVACFRDDIVFLVYLYQRYLYPVDKTRLDMSGMIEESPDSSPDMASTETKKDK
ncbi:hypothetical protein TCAL_02002 [Tigriopus californicus]|uniref:Lipid scramblase CLPTM1L n=1 Tax=Tigriopus californicus TaxID=6832 RepID=A0A553PNP9_TIGCA|nr:lipid scramblase CLPTM1L-like [Tigriopus californicus]TRY79311.1 hypothetical protein TCAL_02002 [Tigriopus californicus]